MTYDYLKFKLIFFKLYLLFFIKNKNISISSYEEPIKENLGKASLSYDKNLAETAKLLKDFNQFVLDAKTSLSSNKVENNLFETDSLGVDSNLGKNFDVLNQVDLKFKEIASNFSDWSKFIISQSNKQQEYAECALINQTDLEHIKGKFKDL